MGNLGESRFTRLLLQQLLILLVGQCALRGDLRRGADAAGTAPIATRIPRLRLLLTRRLNLLLRIRLDAVLQRVLLRLTLI